MILISLHGGQLPMDEQCPARRAHQAIAFEVRTYAQADSSPEVIGYLMLTPATTAGDD